MKKLLLDIILINIIVFLASAYNYILHTQEFTHQDLKDSDVQGWTFDQKIPHFVNECDNKVKFIGGYGIFGQKAKMFKQFTNLRQHTLLRVELTFYKIDSWDKSHNDRFEISIDGKIVYIYKNYDHHTGIAICNNDNSNKNDVIAQISFTINHTEDNFLLLFQCILNEHNKNESCGLRDLKIYINDLCPQTPDHQVIGNNCFTPFELSKCSQSLENLLPKNIKNTSTYHKESDEIFYKFAIQYQNPYTHDDFCFSHKIYVQFSELKEGNSKFDEWKYDASKQEISYQIKHSELESKYQCKKKIEQEKVKYFCNQKMEILLGGEHVQHTFVFEFQTTLNRELSNVIEMNFIDTIGTGGPVQIDIIMKGQLNFCTTFSCTSYHKLPYTASRTEYIFVEHSIDSPVFYLVPKQIKIGGVVPKIIKSDSSQKGKIIYQVSSFLAMKNMKVEVVSLLENQSPKLRFLQEVQQQLQEEEEEEEEEEKELKGSQATGYISIIDVVDNSQVGGDDDDDNNKNEDNSQTTEEDFGFQTIALISVSGVLVIVLIVGSIFLIRKCRKNNDNNNERNGRQEQYQVE